MTGSNEIESIFKSESHSEQCSHCGHDISEDINKAMKKRGKKKISAAALGNEMDPHKGGKTGTFVKQPRTGSLGSAVDRNASSKPKPKSGIVKSFPSVDRVQLVHYDGTTDSALSRQIGDGITTPSLRNLQMEQDAALQQNDE